MPKFRSNAISEHAEVPLADDGRWEALVASWQVRQAHQTPPRITTDESTRASRCFIASVGRERDPEIRAAQLAEIVSLVESQGGQVTGTEIVHLAEPNPRTLLGRGAATAIAERARAAGATMLVLDAELTPSQARNLEDVAGIPICDREAIILNVFLRHARSNRARIQVEIAQLEYLRPRIRGMGLDMDQQTGGTPYARGPGETASELLARKIDKRLEELRKGLRRLETSSRTQRRQREDKKRIVLVGYTNAGKTSLMNGLTAAGLSARDAPFETLDTTSRCLTRHGGDVLVSDTVGFIRRLPERLLTSFESTLAEIVDASLLVVVLDVADHERDEKLRTTIDLLEKLGAAEVPRFFVFNKADRLEARPSDEELRRLSGGCPWMLLSSRDPAAVATLEEALLRDVRAEEETVRLFVPYAATELLALVYGKCRVQESLAKGGGLVLTITGPPAVLAKIRSERRRTA